MGSARVCSVRKLAEGTFHKLCNQLNGEQSVGKLFDAAAGLWSGGRKTEIILYNDA
jgi:hypothetical protein